MSEPAITRPDDGPGADPGPIVDSYRRLADVFHLVLAEQSLDLLLDRIADALADLIPHDTLTIYVADEHQRVLNPVLARDEYAEEILNSPTDFGSGITGWAVEHREPVLAQQAHLDPRVEVVPGTPADDPEALISIPLVARGAVKGALNIYRLGADARFSDGEFELAQRFGDAAALAIDNAHIRARLEHQAQTDALTGLLNHRTFHERLRRELQDASRSGASVGVLMLDLDDFKRVNDVYGHAAGDQVLVAVGDALRSVVRDSDAVCRLGGEEFAVIVTPVAPDGGLALADRVRRLLTSLDFGAAGRITVSVGIAQGPQHAMNPRELVACAEAAMMAAKARGKNRVVRFEEGVHERPEATRADIRPLAHMKLLQSLSGKLNRLNDVREVGTVVADELRSLVDYHNCRVYVVDGDRVVPVAFRGALTAEHDRPLELLACKVGEGITGHVAATGQSMLLGDAARHELALTVPGTEPIQESLLAVALCYGARVTGVLVVSKLGLDQFDEDDARLLEVLGGQAAIALENARLYEAQRREAESATALLDFSRRLARVRGLDETLRVVVEQAAAILRSPRTSLWAQDAETGELVARAQHGHDDALRVQLFAGRFPSGVAEEWLSHGDPFTVSAAQLAELADVRPQSSGFAVAPLELDGGRLGCIAAAEAPGRDFDERELRLLGGLARQAQLAIANADSFQTLEQTVVATLEALATALEAAEAHTCENARSVADLALAVGDELRLDRHTLKRLELAALFHDIGNVGVPSSILTKHGRLTPEERRIVERHSELGERIVAPVDRLQDVARVVRHCHERWDGTGYPDRLAADAIPLEARIIHVSDAFHAMTSDRPYRPRLPREEALRRLGAGAGSQFDPAVVDICVRLLAHDERAAG